MSTPGGTDWMAAGEALAAARLAAGHTPSAETARAVAALLDDHDPVPEPLRRGEQTPGRRSAA